MIRRVKLLKRMVHKPNRRSDAVDFIDLLRTAPFSRNFGYDRGLPIDRYYIEGFLDRYKSDVRGRVLEVGDDSYTRRYGEDRVTQYDVLHVREGNPAATIVADLENAPHIASDTFDCIILTQTLHIIYEFRSALETIHRILKPGGVLLSTFPGISGIAPDQWGDSWFWNFTSVSARRFFHEIFPADQVSMDVYGNVLAAVCFLEGLSREEVRQEDLDFRDPLYEVLIGMRAVKPAAANEVARPSRDEPRPVHSKHPVHPAGQGGKGVILLYHRLAEAASDPWSLCVSPQHFAEHMDVLRERFQPLSAGELVYAIDGGHLEYGSVSITFDDGYADNLSYAKPILQRQNMPATLFVPTGYIGREREFWWDELERILLQPGTLPSPLDIIIDGRAYQWSLDEAVHYTETDVISYRSWRAWQQGPTPRHALYATLWGLLHAAQTIERERVMDLLLAWAGKRSEARSTHRLMTQGEVLDWAGADLLDIGSHGVTHSSLATLSSETQAYEIRESRTYLQGILGHAVPGFSYPFGQTSDFGSETVNLARSAGYLYSCANVEGLIVPTTDCFQMPRLFVRDWDGQKLAEVLSTMFATPSHVGRAER